MTLPTGWFDVGQFKQIDNANVTDGISVEISRPNVTRL
jgi:hypothetical protein